MNLRNDRRPNIQGALHFPSTSAGEAREAEQEESESFPVVHGPERPASTNRLMEEVCERVNLKEAVRRVQANKGSPGVDGMTGRRAPGLLDTALANHPAASPDGDLRAATGETGGNPEAGRRGEKAGHPDGPVILRHRTTAVLIR